MLTMKINFKKFLHNIVSCIAQYDKYFILKTKKY